MALENRDGIFHSHLQIYFSRSMEAGRSYKADHPSAICFLYLVYMPYDLPSSRIFLAESKEDPLTEKILAL